MMMGSTVKTPPRRGTCRGAAADARGVLCQGKETMSQLVPWLLVSLCFVLGVASRSISDTFPVFVPALERGFGAARGDVTVIYSFALLVGGISGPVNGWILDRLGLRALTVIGMVLVALALIA